MKGNGLTRIEALDQYYQSFNQLDRELSNLKLKIAGVEINRQLARSVSPWLILPLLTLLLLRIFVAIRIVRALRDASSVSTLLKATTSTFLQKDSTDTRAGVILKGIVYVAPSIAVLLLIASTPGINQTGADPAWLAVNLGFAVAFSIVIARWQLLRSNQ